MGVVAALKRLAGSAPPPAPTPEPPAPDYDALAARAAGLKLNLGCGFDIRPGLMNVDINDFHKPDLVSDITWLKPVADRSAGFVLAQDVLEHIRRDQCMTALHEWNRVMMDGALLVIRAPDVLALADMLRAPERSSPEAQAFVLHQLFGAQGYEGDFHFNGFTDITIRDNLAQSGFEIVSLRHKDEWLFEVLAKKVRHAPPDPMLRIESNDEFLDAAYRARLGREPDVGGKAFWRGRLESGTPREVVLAALHE